MIAIPPAARRLALGTVQFGLSYGVANTSGQVSREMAATMLRFAAEAGIGTLDTAVAYGESETVLGGLGVDGFRVVGKLPGMPDAVGSVGAWVEAEVAASLARLRIPRLGALLLHRPMELLGPAGPALYDALCAVKRAGMIGKIGVSVYGPGELDALSDLDFDIVQAPFNLFDRRFETSGWLARLAAAGIEVHTRSAFLQGLLLMPRGAIPAKFAAWSELFDGWHAWLESSGVAPVAACLGFVLSRPGIARAVVGADGLEQLRQIVAASGASGAWPEIACADERLLNPARWSELEAPAQGMDRTGKPGNV